MAAEIVRAGCRLALRALPASMRPRRMAAEILLDDVLREPGAAELQ